MPRFGLLPVFAFMTAVSGAALAQTQPTTAQAAALEEQINAWLLQTTVGAIPLPPRTVQMQLEGDHYLVRVPLAPFGQVQPADATFTAKAKPLDGTRWALDDQRFPPDMTFTLATTMPDAPDAKDPSPTGHHTETVTFHAVMGDQESHAVFDPTYATPATSSGSVASLDLTTTRGSQTSTSHFGHVTTQSSTQPTDPLHLNAVSDIAVQGYSLRTAMPDGSDVDVSADRIHVDSALSGLAHEQIFAVIHSTMAFVQMMKAVPAADRSDPPTPAQMAAIRQVLESSRGLLTGGKVDETLEGIKFNYGGAGGSLRKIGISFGGDAPRDMLSADMTLSMDGLALDFLPPSLTSFLPTRFSIHPTVSNISVAALTKMGMDATAPTTPGQQDNAPPPDLQSLFANGGIDVGFDQLALEIEGTQIHGDGTFHVTGPQSVKGQAQFTAHGLDALITKLQSVPMLAQGVPVVIFLKGIARTTGDQAVWQVTLDDTKVLVNGLDLSTMLGGTTR